MQSIVHRVAARLAFFPPTPPSYTLKVHNDGSGEEYIAPVTPGLRKVLGCQVLRLQTKRGNTVVAAYIPCKGQAQTLLVSHGNAVDLGLMLPFYREIARELQVNLLGYDYSGYGASTGQHTVPNVMADIEACYDWLLTQGTKPGSVIAYGQSVGSGPTCHLAAKTPDLAGIVLHSPLASGMRVMHPTWTMWPSWLDVFSNITLMPKIEAPVLIMHGVLDDVVNFSCARALHAAAKRPAEPLWAQDADHQNLELSPQYIPRLRAFLQEIRARNSM